MAGALRRRRGGFLRLTYPRQKMRGTTWFLDKLERGYVRWYARRSFNVPISRDPMALGYTVVARKGASTSPGADGVLGSGSRTWSVSH